MQIVTFPTNEQQRLTDLMSLNILDTPNEKVFDDLSELASLVTGCPIAMISFVDQERLWFKARKNFALQEVPRENSFCSYTINTDNILIIEDTLNDVRFSKVNYINELGAVRFYAGAPILSNTGTRLGAVCVMDYAPRQLSTQQHKSLELMASQASNILYERKDYAQKAGYINHKIQLQKATVRYRIQQHEEERELISSELRTHFANIIKKCTENLRKQNSITLLETIERMEFLYNDVEHLGLNLVPFKHSNEAIVWFKKIVTDFQESSGIHTQLFITGDEDTTQPSQVLVLFRILSELLCAYEQPRAYKMSISVQLNFETSAELILIAEGDRSLLDSDEWEIIMNETTCRAQIAGGSFYCDRDIYNNRILRITLPHALT